MPTSPLFRLGSSSAPPLGRVTSNIGASSRVRSRSTVSQRTSLPLAQDQLVSRGSRTPDDLQRGYQNASPDWPSAGAPRSLGIPLNAAKVKSIRAFSAATKFELDIVIESLPYAGVRFEEALWIPRTEEAHDETGGEVWVFSSGAVVCWNVEDAVAQELINNLYVSAETNIRPLPLETMTTQSFNFLIDAFEHTHLANAVVVLGTLPKPSTDPELATPLRPSCISHTRTFAARYAFSQALSRSVALSAFERSIDAFMVKLEPLRRRMGLEAPSASWYDPAIELLRLRRDYGHPPGPGDGTYGRKFGTDIVSPSSEFYEQQPLLKAYFDAMSSRLDVPERLERLERKLAVASEAALALAASIAEVETEDPIKTWQLFVLYIAVFAAMELFDPYMAVASDCITTHLRIDQFRTAIRREHALQRGEPYTIDGTFEAN